MNVIGTETLLVRKHLFVEGHENAGSRWERLEVVHEGQQVEKRAYLKWQLNQK